MCLCVYCVIAIFKTVCSFIVINLGVCVNLEIYVNAKCIFLQMYLQVKVLGIHCMLIRVCVCVCVPEQCRVLKALVGGLSRDCSMES